MRTRSREAAPQELSLAWETVTPALAERWLSQMGKNRTVRARKVAQFAEDMRTGKWQEDNPQPIIFNTAGELEDGQHRLLAIKKSRVTLRLLVARNAPAEVQYVVDSGTARTFGDALKLNGEEGAPELASIVRWCVTYERDPQLLRTGGQYAPSTSTMLEWLDENPSVRDARLSAKRMRTMGVAIPLAVLGGFYFEVKRIAAKEAVGAFCYGLAEGAELQPGDPILALRKWIGRAAMQRRDRPAAATHGAILIKAWNFWCRGEAIQNLSWRPYGPAPEPFPAILKPLDDFTPVRLVE